MGRSTKDDCTCDLCGVSKTAPHGETPKGWVKIEVDDRFLDRTWHEKICCGFCVALILAANKKASS